MHPYKLLQIAGKTEKIDTGIYELIATINKFKGVETWTSCQGGDECCVNLACGCACLGWVGLRGKNATKFMMRWLSRVYGAWVEFIHGTSDYPEWIVRWKPEAYLMFLEGAKACLTKRAYFNRENKENVKLLKSRKFPVTPRNLEYLRRPATQVFYGQF